MRSSGFNAEYNCCREMYINIYIYIDVTLKKGRPFKAAITSDGR